MKISIGTDPELFVKRDDEWISGAGLIPGTKEHPHKVENGAVQVDGIALEFNTDPADSEGEFLHNIESVLSQLKSMVPYQLIAQPTILFDISSLPKTEQILGCDPDFNAWTEKSNPKPNEQANIRTGAGHIHIGWTKDADISSVDHWKRCLDLIKQCDFFLGLPSLLFDLDTERRSMYGKAGAFRPKTYGAEYRVLSNMWVNTNELRSWVYKASINAVNALVAGEKFWEKYGDIQDIINNSDVKEATRIISREPLLEMPNV